MPKIAFLSDIHSNLPALKAVLQEVAASGADQLYVAGDTVGFAAWPRECLELVRKLAAGCVLGNNDEEVLEILDRGAPVHLDWRDDPYFKGLVHSAKNIDNALAAYLRHLPMILQVPGGVMVHASLHRPREWHYLRNAETAWPTILALRHVESKVGFFGHTHQQAIFSDPDCPEEPEQIAPLAWRLPKGAACAVTVGSVGESRIKGDKRAAWVLWDSDELTVEFRRTSYDNLSTARSILEAGLSRQTAREILDAKQAKALA